MTDKLRLDIPILLPDSPDAADGCVTRLIAQLRGREGIEEVHVIPAIASEAARLCIHYDPERMSLSRIREIAMRAGLRSTR